MPKKKLLWIVEAMGGGVFTYIVELANRLADANEIHLAYGLRPETPPDFRARFDRRVRLIEVESFCREIRPARDFASLLELRRLAREIQPDLIHLHSSKAGALGRLAWNGKKTPLFYTPHGYSFLMEDCSPLKRELYRSIEAVCGRRRCTTVSCGAGEYRESLRLTRRAACIPNGIDVEELHHLLHQAAPTPAGARPFTVYTLGRICPQKGPEAFAAVARAMPDVRFVWVGDGEERNLLAAPNIEITGWVNREQAIRRAVEGDVFLLTSRWEGLPMSLLESMYLGKTCVVSDAAGNRDVIRTGENGFVCRTVEEYAAAIRQAQARRTGPLTRKARREVLETYNADAMARAYQKLYDAKCTG